MKESGQMDYRKIDALVAEKVMGWKKGELNWTIDELWIDSKGSYKWVGKFSPSTNISDAWKVVGKFEDEGYQVCIELLAKKIYSVGIYYPPHADQVAYIKAETAPLAICIASLRTKGIDTNENNKN